MGSGIKIYFIMAALGSNTVLKRKIFWCISTPGDCSWIRRKVLNLCNEVKRFVSYNTGSGNAISLWFDPWWHYQCLAYSVKDHIIHIAGSSIDATIHDLISKGNWILPRQPFSSSFEPFSGKMAGFFRLSSF